MKTVYLPFCLCFQANLHWDWEQCHQANPDPLWGLSLPEHMPHCNDHDLSPCLSLFPGVSTSWRRSGERGSAHTHPLLYWPGLQEHMPNWSDHGLSPCLSLFPGNTTTMIERHCSLAHFHPLWIWLRYDYMYLMEPKWIIKSCPCESLVFRQQNSETDLPRLWFCLPSSNAKTTNYSMTCS